MKTEQNMDLDNKLYSFLDSQINTHFEHLEIVFKECTSEEIKSAADRLIERGMIYIVKYIHDKPLTDNYQGWLSDAQWTFVENSLF